MPYRATSSFKTGNVLVTEGQVYDEDFGLPDFFEEIVAKKAAAPAKKSAPVESDED